MYHVFLNNVKIGTTALESADPPMGVVTGKIAFIPSVSPFHLFRDHCQSHGITLNNADPTEEFIDTHTIPELHVFRTDGVEIAGQGCSISGFRDGGYEVTIIFVPYPFYAEEFPHHRRDYDERFRT